MIQHIIIISLSAFAIHYVFQAGEIFGIAQRIPLGKLADPIRDCPVCMVFWYGTGIYLAAWHTGWQDWLLTVIPALGLNAVLVKLMPDKESPTLHGELETISERLLYIGSTLDPEEPMINKTLDEWRKEYPGNTVISLPKRIYGKRNTKSSGNTGNSKKARS